MPKVNTVVLNFNGGEASELINATRSDLAKYPTLCRTLENAFPLVEGGARKMPGTMFAGLTLQGGPLGTSSLDKARLESFNFSTAEGCILEFGEQYVRVWVNGGLLEGANIPALLASGVSDYNPASAYGVGGLCLVGCVATIQFVPGNVYIASPYAQGSPTSLIPWPNIKVSFNSTDNLSVTVSGTGATQTIYIALANITQSKNSAANLQTAIRALGTINLIAGNSNVPNTLSLASWTVTADAGYSAYNGNPEPWLFIGQQTPPVPFSVKMYAVLGAYQCNKANQNYYFPTANGIWSQYVTPGFIVEVQTPYLEADLFELDFLQSADVIYIFHTSYPPAILSRLSSTAWTYSVYKCRGTADVATTGYSALAQSIVGINVINPGVVAVTSVTQPFNNGDRIYINDVAGTVEINEGEFIVGNIVNPSSDLWEFNLYDINTGVEIGMASWVAYAGGGFAVKVVPMFASPGDYPACGAFYEQRLCVAGSLNNPTQINGSTQGDYNEFICDPNAVDHAIQFTLVSEKVDQIRRMTAAPTALLLGTSGGVWSIAGTAGQSLSQTSVDAEKQISTGVSALAPQRVNDVGIWISRSNRVIYFIIYDYLTNQWQNIDVTRLNRQITLGTSAATSGIVQTAFQSEPYPIFWAVRADGQLLGLVFNKQDQVFAWFRVVTNGLVESVACISQDGQEDQVWIIVNRTINGYVRRFVEYFMPQELFGQLSNAFFVHAGLQWNGGASVSITNITQSNPCIVTAPAHGFQTGYEVQITGVQGMTQVNCDPSSAYEINVIDANTFSLDLIDSTGWSPYVSGGTVMQVTLEVTGLGYLAGQTVAVVGDGAVISGDGMVVPPNGVLVLPYYSNLVTVGLPYTTIIEPVNPVLGAAAQGSSKGELQKVSTITASVYQSIGGKYGADKYSPDYELLYGPGAEGLAPAMVTKDDIPVDFPGDWGYESSFCIVHDVPLPFTLRAISAKITVNPS